MRGIKNNNELSNLSGLENMTSVGGSLNIGDYHSPGYGSHVCEGNDLLSSITGFENLESIAATPGIDSIFVGPADLSVSMGIPGQVTHPREVEAINRVIEVCRQHHVIPGIHMSNVATLKEWIEKGMRFVSFSSDVDLLARAGQESLIRLRNGIEG